MAPWWIQDREQQRHGPRAVHRWEVAGLVAASLGLHTFLALKLASAHTSDPPPRQQQVEIQMVPPPIVPPVVPPQATEPERPRPVRRPVRLAAAPPPPQAETPPPSEIAQESEDPGPLPEGDQELPAAAASPGPPAPPAPAPVVSAHEGANYLKNPRPPYPAVAMRQGWEGEVLVRVRVAPDGTAATVAVQRSSGRDVLDKAALVAVRGWLFVPARQGGAAVAGWVTVPVVFRLQ